MEQIIKQANSNGEIITFARLVDHIGIQGAPGASYTINGAGGIILGPSGIFEMDLEGKGSYITSVKINDDNNHRTIIDIKYFEGGK